MPDRESAAEPASRAKCHLPVQIYRNMAGKVAALSSKHLPAGGLRVKMASGILWSLTSSVGQRGLSMVAMILVAREIGKMGFGQFGVIMSTSALFVYLAGMGVSEVVSKHAAELKQSDPDRVGRMVGLTILCTAANVLILGVACLLSSDWLATSLYQDASLVKPLMLSSLLLAAVVADRVGQGTLSGFEDYRGLALANFAQGVVLVLTVIPAIRWMGLSGAIVALAVSYVASTVWSAWLTAGWCRHWKIRIRFRESWQEKSILWHYMLPSLVIGGMIAPSDVLSKAMVARLPGGFSGLGGFQAAVTWQGVVSFVPMAISRVFLPTFSRLLAGKDHARTVRAVWACIAMNTGLSLAVMIPVAIMSPWILSWYGKDFAGDWDVMLILLVAGVLEAISTALAPLTTATGQMWWRAWIHVVWAVTLVGGTFVLLPTMGVRGYVWAFFAAKASNTLLYCFIGWRGMKKASLAGLDSEPTTAEERIA